MSAPDDIKDPRTKSGFRHVGTHERSSGRRYHAQVYGGKNNKAGHTWQGPMRATALEAAQDYCDYINGGAPQPLSLKTAGHEYVVDERDTDPEYQAALGVIRDRTAQRKNSRQGYIYLIVEDLPGGGLRLGKVGYSVNPRKRAAELQTGNPRPLRLHAIKPGTEADERALHAKYIKNNVLQEWFSITKELLLEWDAKELVR